MLLVQKVIILDKYLDYSNIFSKKLVEVLLERIGIKNYVIKIEKSKQPIFELIYSLVLVKLEIFKSHIKINLINNFITNSNFLIKVFIFVV